MAVVGTPIGYTWSGKQFTDIFLRPIFQDETLKNLFRIVPGIQSSAKLSVDNDFEKILKSAPDCDETTTGSDINIGSATITVCELGFDRSQCFKDFNNTFREEFLKLDANYQNKDNYLQTYIEDKFKQALQRDVLRIGLLGDTASVSADYNSCDGLWKKILAGVADYSITRTIIVDAVVTAAGNNVAGADAFLSYFKEIYYSASVDLKALPTAKKKIIVTGSIHDALDKAYDILKSSNGFLDGLQKSGERLTFKGIDIIPIWRLDGYIENDLSGVNPHRIIYYAPEAVAFGFDGESETENVEVLPDPYSKKVHYRGYMKMGTTIIHSGFIRVGY